MKPSELNFSANLNSASPNSRILSSDSNAGAPLARSFSSISRTSTTNSNGATPPRHPAAVDLESEESQEDGPRRPQRSSSITTPTKKVSRNSNGTVVSPVRTDSPTDLDEESKDSDEYASPAFDEASKEEGDDEFVEAQDGRRRSLGGDGGLSEGDAKAAGRSASRGRRKSRAATIAAEAMEAEINLRGKKGKPLSSLVYDDVALTEADIKEVSLFPACLRRDGELMLAPVCKDIAVVWKALWVFGRR